VTSKRNWLSLDEKAIEVVREGMRDVVNSGYGTGRSAALSFAKLCGKTGTAQWGPPSKDQRLAWFACFLPFDEPRYAFAALYVCRPGERLSGGRNAAPIVKSFFEPLKSEFKEILAPAPKALEIIDEEEEVVKAEEVPEDGGETTEGVLRAQEVELLDPDDTDDDADAVEEVPRALPVDPGDLPED
jgi:penicillin-binding protein 2